MQRNFFQHEPSVDGCDIFTIVIFIVISQVFWWDSALRLETEAVFCHTTRITLLRVGLGGLALAGHLG